MFFYIGQKYHNIDILGYEEFKFEPTRTTHGGTGFYIKESTDYIIRKDLQINSPSDHVPIFMEIKFPNKKNLVVGCVYRHPNSNISVHDFTYVLLDSILKKLSGENKQCILMGDFNINLKINTNDSYNSFYNSLSSHFFTPFIL